MTAKTEIVLGADQFEKLLKRRRMRLVAVHLLFVGQVSDYKTKLRQFIVDR
jgi:hypothetical protein